MGYFRINDVIRIYSELKRNILLLTEINSEMYVYVYL